MIHQVTRRLAHTQWLTRWRGRAVERLALAAATIAGLSIVLAPEITPQVPSFALAEFVGQMGAVAAAMDTVRTTHALPISSSEIFPGIEYPYILFGNMAFYLIAAFIGTVLGLPAYLAGGATLAAGFVLAVWSVSLLARRAGLNPYLSIALGFLYATGPYLSLDLFVRNSFPEYLTWHITPVLLLLLIWALRPGAGPLMVLVGALALAAPFYFHKLLAPHIALTLAALALNAAPWRISTVARMALICGIALSFSVPAWSPSFRSFAGESLGRMGVGGVPGIFHHTLADVFWPVAVSSLPDGPELDMYRGRFALQAGLVPLAGGVVAIGTLLLQPRLAWKRRMVLPLALFVVNVLLVLGWLGLWEILPSALKFVQFSYRLLGLVHLLGFLLFMQALGSPEHLLRRMPVLALRSAAVVFVILAIMSVSTYWHRPPPSMLVSADIQPSDLGRFDRCSLCSPTPWSSLVTVWAIHPDQTLLVPPVPIAVPPETGSTSLVLEAEALPMVFEASPEALTVRLYGLTRVEPQATLAQATAVMGASPTVSAPLTALSQSAAPSPSGATAADPRSVRLPGVAWAARSLAEITVSGAGPIHLQAAIDPSIAAVAVECSRGVSPKDLVPNLADARKRCLQIDALALPNVGAAFVRPQEIPRAQVTRYPLGTTVIDASALPAGPYLLPTFNYPFVRIVDSAGKPVPTYEFDRRPAIDHTGAAQAYTITYDFTPERNAVMAGLIGFLVYVLATRLGIFSPSCWGAQAPTSRAA
jgi:hypothetical protein